MYRVWYYLQFQGSTQGLKMSPPGTRDDCCIDCPFLETLPSSDFCDPQALGFSFPLWPLHTPLGFCSWPFSLLTVFPCLLSSAPFASVTECSRMPPNPSLWDSFSLECQNHKVSCPAGCFTGLRSTSALHYLVPFLHSVLLLGSQTVICPVDVPFSLTHAPSVLVSGCCTKLPET